MCLLPCSPAAQPLGLSYSATPPPLPIQPVLCEVTSVMSDSVDYTSEAPLSMEFSRQEYRSRLPCPPPENSSDPGIKPMSFMSPALAGGFFTTSTTSETCIDCLLPLFLLSCVFLPSSFYRDIFLCCLILSSLVCSLSLFHRLQGHSSLRFCCLLPGG